MHGWRLDLALIAAVLLLAGGVKAWLFTHSPAMARDGIDFVQYASYLGQEPWSDVVRESYQHPLYPIHIHLLAQVVPASEDTPLAVHWQRLAQLASLIAGLLLAPLVYLLGKALFDRRVGFASALLLQALPAMAVISVDALSESTFLLYFTAAMLCAVYGLQTRAWGWFLAAGTAGALAYLTRPEGLAVIAVTLAVLFGLKLLRLWDGSWRLAAGCSAAALAGLCIVAAPFWFTIGGLSNKPATRQLARQSEVRDQRSENERERRGVSPTWPDNRLLFASRFMPGTDGNENVTITIWHALGELLKELGQATFYVLWLPALVGMVWFARRGRTQPALLLPVAFCGIYFFALWRLAVTAQYVSERHVLPLVVCGTVFAVAMIFEACRNLTPLPASLRGKGEKDGSGVRGLLLPGTIIALICVAASFKTFKPLHAQQVGHREAGYWLAQHGVSRERLVDPYGLATYYSGRALCHLSPESVTPGSTTHRYMIVETNDKDLHRTRLFDEERDAIGLGDVVFAWPAGKPRLVVYRALEKPGYPSNLPGPSRYLRRHR